MAMAMRCRHGLCLRRARFTVNATIGKPDSKGLLSFSACERHANKLAVALMFAYNTEVSVTGPRSITTLTPNGEMSMVVYPDE
jgi:hypothetical protein